MLNYIIICQKITHIPITTNIFFTTVTASKDLSILTSISRLGYRFRSLAATHCRAAREICADCMCSVHGDGLQHVEIVHSNSPAQICWSNWIILPGENETGSSDGRVSVSEFPGRCARTIFQVKDGLLHPKSREVALKTASEVGFLWYIAVKHVHYIWRCTELDGDILNALTFLIF